MHSRVLLQYETWARAKTKVFTQSTRHAAENIPITGWAEGGIHSLIPGRQCPKASCYSRSGNVSAFNGIVNRNAFPRGSEEDWHCCSDCNTQTAGSHTLTYKSYHSTSAHTPLHVCRCALVMHSLWIAVLFKGAVQMNLPLLLVSLKQFPSTVMTGSHRGT